MVSRHGCCWVPWFCLTAQGASGAVWFVCSSAPIYTWVCLWWCGGLVVASANGGGGCQELLVGAVVDVLHFGLGLGFGLSWGVWADLYFWASGLWVWNFIVYLGI